ncbi:helix-turn-helix domain-containing protein [Sphingomonas sp. LR60]|uniref:helix-turn-helix domain-containing protein n=1 Tax=Sphingomonas sp. LR60 TaxID=3050233 RepID=UPI002FDFAD1A
MKSEVSGLTPKALSIGEAHRIMGVGKTTLYALLSRNELDTIRIGRRRLILASSIDAFIQRSTTRGGAEMGYSSRKANPQLDDNNKVTKRKRNAPILQRIFSGRPKEQEIVSNLRGMSEPILTYAATGAVRTELEFVEEVAARLQALNEINPLKKIGVMLTCAQECDASARRLVLDMSKARKPANSFKKRQPHSISRAVTTLALPIAEDEAFAVACSVVSLFVEFVNAATSYPGTRTRAQQPSSIPSHRPELPTEVCENPTAADIRAMVEKFVRAPKTLQRNANEKALAIGKERWRASRRQRALVEFQLGVLTPVQKVYSAAGLSEAILRQALAPSIVRASNAKQRRGWLDRADVIHLLWEHALETHGAPPPLVKL